MNKIILALSLMLIVPFISNAQDHERKCGFTLGLEYRYLAFTSGEVYDPGWYSGPLYSDAKGMSLRFYLGYYITKNMVLNAGFGLDGYQNPGSNTAPLVLQAKYHFNNGLKGFYAFAEGGPLLNLSPAGTLDKGETYGAGIGKNFKLFRILKLSTSIGYCYQNSSNDTFGGEFTRNSMLLGLGLFF